MCASLVSFAVGALQAPTGAASGPAAASAPAPPVLRMKIAGAIGPATADYLHRGLALAERQRAQLVLIQLDTPGGLDASMRDIIKDILASSVPVVTWVAPNGARAASAGTYILYASHIAAMAPATNVGAATPVAIGLPGSQPDNPLPPAKPNASAPGDGAGAASGAPAASDRAIDAMAAKRIGDAAAYIRSLAHLRGRNAVWAERAVREAVSLAAPEALALKVVDLVAESAEDLLRQLDGREIKLAATAAGVAGAAGDAAGAGVGPTVRLATQGAAIVDFEPDWRTKLLATLTDPSVALILMLIGIYGLLFEFSTPGLVVPGVVGGICLLMALFAFQMLPVNYAGLALILLGVAFLVAEVFMPSYGALGIGGITAFAIGAVLLIDTEVPGFGIPLALIGGLTAVTALFVLVVVAMAVRARRRPLANMVAGGRVMLGAQGAVLEMAGDEGWALIGGEHWKVRARGGGTLRVGQRVRVTGAEGLVLEVGAVPSDAGDDAPARAA